MKTTETTPPPDCALSTADHMANLRESLAAELSKLQSQISAITRKNRWTQEEAAQLVLCSVKAIKDALDKGLLKTGTSKWITRPQLEQWLGFDPVEDAIRRARMLDRQIREITSEIEPRLETLEQDLVMANSGSSTTPE